LRAEVAFVFCILSQNKKAIPGGIAFSVVMIMLNGLD